MQAALFKRNAVLVEQNPIHCRLYGDVLETSGFEVYVASSIMDALVKIKQTPQDLVVINTEIVEEKFIRKFLLNVKNEVSHELPILGVSIYPTEKKENIAKILDSFLTKPFSIDTFTESVVKCTEKKDDSESFSSQ